MKVRAQNIVWDFEDDFDDDVSPPFLPTEVEIELDNDQDPFMETSDALSDIYGWCVSSLDIEVIEDTPISKF